MFVYTWETIIYKYVMQTFYSSINKIDIYMFSDLESHIIQGYNKRLRLAW